MTVTLSELPFLIASLAIWLQAVWNRYDLGSKSVSSFREPRKKRILTVIIGDLYMHLMPRHTNQHFLQHSLQHCLQDSAAGLYCILLLQHFRQHLQHCRARHSATVLSAMLQDMFLKCYVLHINNIKILVKINNSMILWTLQFIYKA